MINDPPHENEEVVIPLAEEHAAVTKEKVITGRVRVHTETEQVSKSIVEDLAGEIVDVERVRVDQEIAPGTPLPQVRTEGDVTIIPVFEEILVVEKRLVLREEIHLRRIKTNEHIEQPVTLRKQRAVIDRTGNDSTTAHTPENMSWHKES